MIGSVLRILEFETPLADVEIDALLRDQIAPNPAGITGLSRTLVGRRLTNSSRRYLVATVWDNRDAMEAVVLNGGVAVYQTPFARYLGNATLVAVDLAVGWWSSELDRLSTIRLFRDADLAMGGPSPTGVGNSGASSDDDPGPSACFIFSSNVSAERVMLAGWPRVGQDPMGSPMPSEALGLLDRIEAMIEAGLGTDYEVVGDRATRQSG